MKNLSLPSALAFAVMFGVAGCGRKTDANSELQRAAEAVGPAPSAPSAQAGTAAPPTPAQHVDQALTSFKAGNYNDAVTQLHTITTQGSSGKMPMTPQQYMAVQDASRSVLADLYTRAANGDTKAQQAIKEYQRLNH